MHVPNRGLVSCYSRVIDHCFSVKSLDFAKCAHSQLIKVGLSCNTFLGNRCLDMYCRFGPFDDALKVFDEITDRNVFSWNIWLKGLFHFGHLDLALKLFDEMPERDAVSWNSVIAGCSSQGYSGYALNVFSNMQIVGVKPSAFTYSILLSTVNSIDLGKQIHANMITRGIEGPSLVLENSLVDMYGNLGLIDYAIEVISKMDVMDIISWNSLISGLWKSGNGELALHQFSLMRSICTADEFTISTIIAACSDLQNLVKGMQAFTLCIKMGFFDNPIVCSATIDLFSKCNRLEDSVQLFEELDQWNSALCDSMISGFARHDMDEEVLNLFLLSMRKDVRPTGHTLSSLLSTVSLLLAEQGGQLHSLVVRLGMESDVFVASSLIEMYCKLGLSFSAMKVFTEMEVNDIVLWNTIIVGLSRNGGFLTALNIFKELLNDGPPPDRITLHGALLACYYGGFSDEGVTIFSSMEEKYRIVPGKEHFSSIVDLLCESGKFKEAIDIVQRVPYEPSPLFWDSILQTCASNGDLELTERVAETLTQFQPHSSLPYLVMARVYEMSAKWEDVVRVRKITEQRGVNANKVTTGCSCIAIRNCIYTFKADQLQHYGGNKIYEVLRLLIWETDDECYCGT